MELTNASSDLAQPPPARWALGAALVGGLGALLLASIVLGGLLVTAPGLAAAVALGVPLVAVLLVLAFRPGTQRVALLGLFAVAPTTGLLKVITGQRYSPLLFDLLLVVLVAVVILSGRARFPAAGLWVLLLLALAALEMIHPNIPSFGLALEGFHKFMFLGLAFFVAQASFIDRKFLRQFTVLLLIQASIMALYGIKQFLFPSDFDWRLIGFSEPGADISFTVAGHLRAFASTSGPFHLGIYLASTIVLAVALWPPARPRQRVGLAVALLIMILGLGFTVTKGNWVGAVAGVGVVLLLGGGLRWAKRFLPLLAILAAVLVFVVLPAIIALDPGGAVAVGLRDVLNPTRAQTFLLRTASWQQVIIPAILDHPWLGYGTGAAGEGVQHNVVAGGGLGFYSHSLYFKIPLEMGLLGLVVFLALMGTVLWRGRRVQARVHDPFLRAVLLWCLGFAVAMLVSCIVGPMLDAYPANMLFWFTLGLVSRVDRLNRQAAAAPDPVPAGPAAPRVPVGAAS
jgi:putative inorganic carbon (hco3(-)) transporter